MDRKYDLLPRCGWRPGWGVKPGLVDPIPRDPGSLNGGRTGKGCNVAFGVDEMRGGFEPYGFDVLALSKGAMGGNEVKAADSVRGGKLKNKNVVDLGVESEMTVRTRR
jgi:hypothetical protein